MIDIAARRVVDWRLPEGDQLKVGQVLAQQDVAEIDAWVRAQCAQAVQPLGRARAEIEARRSAAAARATGVDAGLHGKKLVSDVRAAAPADHGAPGHERGART
jgi:hypothetical protein